MLQSLNSLLGSGEPQQVFEQGDATDQLWGEWEWWPPAGKPLSSGLLDTLVAWLRMVAVRMERSCLSPF